jgi:uncharacterized membrane protein YraQ (UPF0718 family)
MKYFANYKAGIITILFVLLVLVVFWDDRYGGLIAKYNTSLTPDWALNGGILDKLSLDAGIVKNSKFIYDNSIFEKSVNTFLNWVYTNRKGMSFAVIFGALILTLFSFLRISNPKNKYLQALYGALLGSPLGVCSNCVAPIAKSFYESGFKQITSLAVLIASPTLNIVVLLIVFTIFPFYISVCYLLSVLFLIFFVLPTFFTESDEAKKVYAQSKQICEIKPDSISNGDTWLRSLVLFLKVYLKNFWYIFIYTVPLMAVGGFVGAFVAHAYDLSAWLQSDSYVNIFLVSLVSTFLPVPTAFHVFYTEYLIFLGTPYSLIVTVLITMGTYSVYSMSIVWQTFGKKVAIKLFIAVLFTGFLFGTITKVLNIEAEVGDYKSEVLSNKL